MSTRGGKRKKGGGGGEGGRSPAVLDARSGGKKRGKKGEGGVRRGGKKRGKGEWTALAGVAAQNPCSVAAIFDG